MPQIDKRGRSYRARYYDPLGRRHTKSFVRKADAERFLREMKPRWTVATGSIRATQRCRSPSGPRSSFRSRDDSPRRPADLPTRQRDAMERTDRTSTVQARHATPQSSSDRSADPSRQWRVATERAEDSGLGALDHDLWDHSVSAR
jgi:hypothetical protein